MVFVVNFQLKQNAKTPTLIKFLPDKSIINKQIELAKENNQNAFSYLMNCFWDDVYNYQLKRTGNEIDSEDITIESFAKAFNKISSFDSKYEFKTWLITISKNLHIDKAS